MEKEYSFRADMFVLLMAYEKVLPLQNKVDMRVIAIKGYSKLLINSEVKLHHQLVPWLGDPVLGLLYS